MSQIWTDDPFSSGNVGQTDLQNIENNLLSLKSNFSGTSAPSNAVAGMHWYDSGTGNKVMKLYLESSWVAYMHGDASQKILIYRNTAMDGWSIDSSSATDRVIAIKGGSTYTTGGANAGSWTISGVTNDSDSHNHKWYNQAATTHQSYDSNGDAYNLNNGTSPSGMHIPLCQGDDIGQDLALFGTTEENDCWTDSDSHSHTISSDGTWRVAAAVFTMQYLDI